MFAIVGALFEKLPNESSFANRWQATKNVNAGQENLVVINVGKTGFTARKFLSVFNVFLKIMEEKIGFILEINNDRARR